GGAGGEGAAGGVAVGGGALGDELVALVKHRRGRAVASEISGAVPAVGRRGAAGGPGREPTSRVVGVAVSGDAGDPGGGFRGEVVVVVVAVGGRRGDRAGRGCHGVAGGAAERVVADGAGGVADAVADAGEVVGVVVA